MEFGARATEKDQRLLPAPWLRPRLSEGRTHSFRASPGVRLQSCVARPRPGVKAGRGFHQAPSPWAGQLGTCWDDFNLGRDRGAAGRAGTSGQQRQPLGPGSLERGGQPVLAGTTSRGKRRERGPAEGGPPGGEGGGAGSAPG